MNRTLALLLLLSCAGTVWAKTVEVSTYAELKAAILSGAASASTVKITADIKDFAGRLTVDSKQAIVGACGADPCILEQAKEIKAKENDVFFHVSQDNEASFENLKMMNAVQTIDPGAAMVLYGYAKFKTCIFDSNSAKTKNTGAVHIHPYGSAAFDDCTFTNNTASGESANAGAVYDGSQATYGTTFNKCTFTSNSAGRDAGAVYVRGKSTFTDCTFTSNSAGGKGGAIQSFSQKNVTFVGCTFKSNTAKGAGKDIYLEKYASIFIAGSDNNIKADSSTIECLSTTGKEACMKFTGPAPSFPGDSSAANHYFHTLLIVAVAFMLAA